MNTTLYKSTQQKFFLNFLLSTLYAVILKSEKEINNFSLFFNIFWGFSKIVNLCRTIMSRIFKELPSKA